MNRTFSIEPTAVVVTTTYVTRQHDPIRYVTHEYDAAEGVVWQFHSGNGDYRPEVLQLVTLTEILGIDPQIVALAELPCGWCATRESADSEWIFAELE